MVPHARDRIRRVARRRIPRPERWQRGAEHARRRMRGLRRWQGRQTGRAQNAVPHHGRRLRGAGGRLQRSAHRLSVRLRGSAQEIHSRNIHFGVLLRRQRRADAQRSAAAARTCRPVDYGIARFSGIRPRRYRVVRRNVERDGRCCDRRARRRAARRGILLRGAGGAQAE